MALWEGLAVGLRGLSHLFLFFLPAMDPVPDVELVLVVFWNLVSSVSPDISVPLMDSAMLKNLYVEMMYVEIIMKNIICTNPVDRGNLRMYDMTEDARVIVFLVSVGCPRDAYEGLM